MKIEEREREREGEWWERREVWERSGAVGAEGVVKVAEGRDKVEGKLKEF